MIDWLDWDRVDIWWASKFVLEIDFMQTNKDTGAVDLKWRENWIYLHVCYLPSQFDSQLVQTW